MSCINRTKLLAAALVAGALISSTPFAAETKSAAASPASVTKNKPAVMAEVNGVLITLDDFNREVSHMSAMQKAIVETPRGRRELVDSLVTRELAVQQAAKTGFDKDREFKARVEHLKKSFIANEYMTKLINVAAVLSDAEVRKYYEDHISNYQAGERIHAANLQVRTEEEAKAILAQIKAGASYEELARQKSADKKGAANGGDKGWFDRGGLGAPFDKAVADLKAGEISGIVKSNRWFHIIKIIEIRPPGTRLLDEAAPMIRETLAQGQREKAIQKVTQDLRKNARVTIKEDTLAAMGGKEEPESPIQIIPVEDSAEPAKPAEAAKPAEQAKPADVPKN